MSRRVDYPIGQNDCDNVGNGDVGGYVASLERDSSATAEAGQVCDCLSILMYKFHDVNKRVNGVTPLYTAACRGHVECIRKLVSIGADVNSRLDFWAGTSPFLKVASDGYLDCMQVLINAGTDVNLVDEHQRSALYFSAQRGDEDCLRTLLREGARVNTPDSSGYTAVGKAFLNGYEAIVETLISAGGNIYIRNMDYKRQINSEGADYQRYKDLCDRVTMSWVKMDERPTIMVRAAWKGDIALLIKYLERGFDVNEKDPSDGSTALIASAWEGHYEIVDFLLKQDDVDVNARDGQGRTALFAATCDGRVDCVKRLVAHGDVDVDIENSSHTHATPLMIASEKNRSECLKVLISAGANAARCCLGSCILDLASEVGSAECLPILIQALSYQPSFNVAAQCARACNTAMNRGQVRCLEILLEYIPQEFKKTEKMLFTLVFAACYIRQTPGRLLCLFPLLKAGVFSWSWYPEFVCRSNIILIRELLFVGIEPDEFRYLGLPCTPLKHAFLTNDFGMVRYLLANWYLTPGDLTQLKSCTFLRDQVQDNGSNEVKEIYQKLTKSPLRLESLSLLKISATLKTPPNGNRAEVVNKSTLSDHLSQELLAVLKYETPYRYICEYDLDNIQGEVLNFSQNLTLRKNEWPADSTISCNMCAGHCKRFLLREK